MPLAIRCCGCILWPRYSQPQEYRVSIGMQCASMEGNSGTTRVYRECMRAEWVLNIPISSCGLQVGVGLCTLTTFNCIKLYVM